MSCIARSVSGFLRRLRISTNPVHGSTGIQLGGATAIAFVLCFEDEDEDEEHTSGILFGIGSALAWDESGMISASVRYHLALALSRWCSLKFFCFSKVRRSPS